MKAKYIFGKVSFLIICGLLVSFSFVKEFEVRNILNTHTSNPLQNHKDLIDKKGTGIVYLKFYDRDNQLVYRTKVDLNDDARKKDKELLSYLESAELIKKVDHTLYLRLNKF